MVYDKVHIGVGLIFVTRYSGTNVFLYGKVLGNEAWMQCAPVCLGDTGNTLFLMRTHDMKGWN